MLKVRQKAGNVSCLQVEVAGSWVPQMQQRLRAARSRHCIQSVACPEVLMESTFTNFLMFYHVFNETARYCSHLQA